MHANYELYSMLQEYPQLKSKFSLWKLLSTAAELGHGDAQHALSTAYATGVFLDTLIPMDSNRALLLEYSASLAGHPVANMGMGYRFMNGINVDVSCDRALPHYEFAANLAASYLEEEDSLVPLIDRSRLSDVIGTSFCYDLYLNIIYNSPASSCPMNRWISKRWGLEPSGYFSGAC